MNKKDLIALIEALPDNAEIVTYGEYDSILGGQDVNFSISIDEDEIGSYKTRKGFTVWQSTISNYIDPDSETKKVWVINKWG